MDGWMHMHVRKEIIVYSTELNNNNNNNNNNKTMNDARVNE
jgi:hypothetical protein